MSYRESVVKEFKLPSGQRFLIRKINPLRVPELRKIKPETNDPEAIEHVINATLMAGVAEPKLRLEGLDVYIENEDEPLTYDDKMTLMMAINHWSGISPEAMRERQKFCEQQLGLRSSHAG